MLSSTGLATPIEEIRDGLASIAIATSSDSSRPGGNSAQQGSRAGHERQDDRTTTGPTDVLLHTRSHFVHRRSASGAGVPVSDAMSLAK